MDCYKTPGNKIGIQVRQRIPLLRVMAHSGEDYYIDMKGKVMPVPDKVAHVAVITGFVDKKFASKELYKLGKYLLGFEVFASKLLIKKHEVIPCTAHNATSIPANIFLFILFALIMLPYTVHFSLQSYIPVTSFLVHNLTWMVWGKKAQKKLLLRLKAVLVFL